MATKKKQKKAKPSTTTKKAVSKKARTARKTSSRSKKSPSAQKKTKPRAGANQRPKKSAVGSPSKAMINPKKKGRPKGQKNDSTTKKRISKEQLSKAMEFPRVLVFVGLVTEFFFEDDDDGFSYVWDSKDKKILATDPMGKKLFIFSKIPSKGEHIRPDGAELLAAERTFKGFHFRDSRDKKALNVETSGFAKHGKAISIRYVSERQGKPSAYFHQFASSPRVWGNRKSKNIMFVIEGEKLKVTTEGIKG